MARDVPVQPGGSSARPAPGSRVAGYVLEEDLACLQRLR